MSDALDQAAREACPFCDGEPQLIDGGPGNFYVRCVQCNATGDDGSRDYALSRWNRRAARSAPEAGKAVVKPLDLSNLLRHAFMFGFETMGGTAEAAKAWWPEYNPEECPAFERILSALASSPAPPGAEPVAWRDVIAERQRQVSAEGWTPEHDDNHTDGSLAMAAASYALGRTCTLNVRGEIVQLWPWEGWSFKLTDHRRDLVKAGALILAEIERLDRAAKG